MSEVRALSGPLTMETVKKYKTISILVGLIIIFGFLAVFVKVFDIGGIKTSPETKIAVSPTPTPVTDPFIHPESLNISASYMGYSVTKVIQQDLGKAALKYGNKDVDLNGTEWVIKKSKVSDVEYSQIKSLINAYVQGQIVNKGWKKNVVVNGQEMMPNIPSANDLDLGYVVVSGGKCQIAILEGSKDKSGTVQFKLFLSNIANLNDL